MVKTAGGVPHLVGQFCHSSCVGRRKGGETSYWKDRRWQLHSSGWHGENCVINGVNFVLEIMKEVVALLSGGGNSSVGRSEEPVHCREQDF